ncbi:MAG: hypothetical protein ACUVV5_10110 [Candidatus Aminicenantales bacterium]
MRLRMKNFTYPHAATKLVIEVSSEPRIAILGAAPLLLDAKRKTNNDRGGSGLSDG